MLPKGLFRSASLSVIEGGFDAVEVLEAEDPSKGDFQVLRLEEELADEADPRCRRS